LFIFFLLVVVVVCVKSWLFNLAAVHSFFS